MIEKLKGFIQLLLQKMFGYPTYLFAFSVFKIVQYRLFQNEADFKCFINLTKTVNPSIIIDAGANIGYTGVLFAKANPLHQIYCYEPVTLLNSVIKKVVRFFNINNIHVKPFALGNKNDVVLIETPVIGGVKKQGLSHIKTESATGEKQEEAAQLIEQVQMVSLDDDLLNKINLPVVGIKVDVENFEYFVLQGALQLIRLYKPIIMAELWENEVKNDCIRLLEDEGYEVKVLQANELIVYENQQTLNYFFIPKSR